MTNYNKRLDELMPCDCKFLKGFAWRKGDPCEGCINGRLKQALTSLTKELVAEAKPYDKQGQIDIDSPAYNDGYYSGAHNALEKFKQNLLKALEEK